MGDLALNIAASGIDAQQAAIDTISENLSNAQTPGYVAESVELAPALGGNGLGVGDGVDVVGLSQSSDQLLATNALQTQGALSQTTSLQQILQAAQSVFPVSTTSGIATDLSNFWQSWDAIDQNPTSLAPRTQVVDQAQGLVTDFQQAAQQLANLSTNTQSQITSGAAQANTLLQQMANLNSQIATTVGSGSSPDSLIDDENEIMSELATSIGAVAEPQSNGTMNVSVGGITLVQGSWNDTIDVTGTAGDMSLVAQTSGATLPVSGGSLAGQLAAVNQYIPSYQSQLDATANALATTVNNQLAAGYTATGASGAGYPLFEGSGAAGLSVNPAVAGNPQLIAASDTAAQPDATNDGNNAQAMAELYDAPTGPDSQYQSLIQGLGSQVQSVNNQVTTQTSAANAAQQNLQSVQGVNTNDQMVQLLNYQEAYQASAKLISTVDTMMQSLIQAA